MTPARLLLMMASAAVLSREVRAQSLEVRAEATRGTVGDPITLRLTVRLPPGMELIDAVPHPLVPPPRGIRVLSADSLRQAGAGVFTGRARVAFYRIGPQPVPTLALLYRTAPGNPPDTLVHMPISIEISPILAAGNPELRDIRPLISIGGPVWAPVAAIVGLIGLGFWWLRRRSRFGGSPARQPAAAPPPGPFDAALLRLEEIERTARASGDGIVPLYAGAADVLRSCLVDVGALPHQGLTTPEVGTALPSRLSAGDLGARCLAVLGEADLVKFAKLRPDLSTAVDQLGRTRALLEAWRDAESPSRRADG